MKKIGYIYLLVLIFVVIISYMLTIDKKINDVKTSDNKSFVNIPGWRKVQIEDEFGVKTNNFFYEFTSTNGYMYKSDIDKIRSKIRIVYKDGNFLFDFFTKNDSKIKFTNYKPVEKNLKPNLDKPEPNKKNFISLYTC